MARRNRSHGLTRRIPDTFGVSCASGQARSDAFACWMDGTSGHRIGDCEILLWSTCLRVFLSSKETGILLALYGCHERVV